VFGEFEGAPILHPVTECVENAINTMGNIEALLVKKS